jgi:hypothetical protein
MEKVIIIGAGPAGLTAAIELLKNGGDYDVTILEGSQAMGGISQTVRYNGNRMDIGGHRFFSKNQQVMDWWADLMPLQGKPAYDDKKLGHEKPLAENGPDPETEDNVMLVRDRVSRIYYNKHFFDYPISMKPETIKNMGFVTEALRRVIRFCFEETGVQRLEAEVMTVNVASNRVMEKCGFTCEGTKRQAKFVNIYTDFNIYGLLRSDIMGERAAST